MLRFVSSLLLTLNLPVNLHQDSSEKETSSCRENFKQKKQKTIESSFLREPWHHRFQSITKSPLQTRGWRHFNSHFFFQTELKSATTKFSLTSGLFSSLHSFFKNYLSENPFPHYIRHHYNNVQLRDKLNFDLINV